MPTMRCLGTLGALLLGASLAHAGPVDDCNQVHELFVGDVMEEAEKKRLKRMRAWGQD